jgi:predicted alpha-1,2-mannosidase
MYAMIQQHQSIPMRYSLITGAAMLLALQVPAQKLTRFVDPFLGTGGHGHVYPGATVPFGMVQLSPDNGVNGWDWCSGYHYSSDSIAGFSHTHLSGTGIGDWCDISVLPLPDDRDLVRQDRIRLPFSHANESAKPGYYAVRFDNGIRAELTSTTRNGYHRYTFPGQSGWLRFDMGFTINWDSATAGMLKVADDSTLIGSRFSTGWAKGQRVFFAARFSRPIREILWSGDGKADGRQQTGPTSRASLRFEVNGSPLYTRVAISTIGTDEALAALQETEGAGFDRVSADAERLWETELEKIRIDTTDRDKAVTFYTALYRTCLSPVVHSDADGRYRTHDGTIRKQTNGDKYTIFSLWDTFRALHPLFTITQPGRVPDMINSMLSFHDDNGLLPVWDISTWEANTMTGYHAIPVIADAILKGIPGFDREKAYEAMKKSANQLQRGTPDFIRFGYIPQEKHGWSVTYTLEYAFDDWCIAQVAAKLNRTADHAYYMKRAMNYKNLFDPTTGFMRAKDSSGRFIEPFDPLISEHGFEGQYIEGTAWQHSFFVPHDMEGFAALHGGRSQLVKKIDELFASPSILKGDNVSVDVTGLIGQYAHGNEPSHHIIYMYTLLGRPDLAAKWIGLVADSMYKTGPDGLIGNDDCGQMSAWYVWSSLGMYPLNPVSGEYVFGVPLVNKATIRLGGKKQLSMTVIRRSGSAAKGIVSAKLNGRRIPVRSISHQQLQKGGRLVFTVNE